MRKRGNQPPGYTGPGQHTGSARSSSVGSTVVQVVYLILFLLFVFVSIYVDRDASYSPAPGISAEGGWTIEGTGEETDTVHFPQGPLAVSRNIEGQYTAGQALCLKSIDTEFDVLADGRVIYSYRPVIPERLGKSYGMFVHTVVIPDGTRVISLKLDPVFPGIQAGLDDVVIGDAERYMSALFRQNIVTFSQSSVNLIIGTLFLAVGLFSRILMKSSGLDFVSFGAMAALIGLFGYNDTLLLQVMTGHPALVRVFTYICLIFLPFPAVSFIASATGHSRSRLVPGMLALCLANFAAQILLTHRGVSDYYYLVTVSHGVILLGFVITIVFVVRAIQRKTIDPELLRFLLAGLSACAAGVVIDLVRYHFSQSFGSSVFTRHGIFVFMLLIVVYLFRRQLRDLRKQNREHRTYIRELSEAIAKVVDMKDRYTNGHSMRVAKYTAMLARELGYDEETVEKYYSIALLHDVGKIGIPKEVLGKPGKLTKEEYEIIKSHTSKGYDALKDISIMPELAVGAQYHHERPDGRGYPDHLRGSEIPRVAQIISVADCFDAMYSDRPYRSRMNFERAVSIIREVAGTQLAQDVVEAFLRLVEKGKFRALDDDGGGSMENIENIHAAQERESAGNR